MDAARSRANVRANSKQCECNDFAWELRVEVSDPPPTGCSTKED